MKYKINLLTLKKETLSDRVVYFALHYLRYILVITQIVVIIVFFIKFKVDQEIIDLKESVSQKQEIIAVSKPLIDEAQRINRQIGEISTIVTEQDNLREAFNYILSVFPADLYLSSLSIRGTKFVLTGMSANPNAIRFFLNRLQKDARFESIALKNIQKKDDGLYFSFDLDTYKK